MIFFFLKLLTSCAALFLHTVGLLAIYFYDKKTNQNLILSSLSVSEVIALVTWIIESACDEAIQRGLLNREALIRIMSTSVYIAHYQLLLVMIILTVDRLVCVINPLRYKSRGTRKRLIKVVAASWIFSSSIGITYFVTSNIAIQIVIATGIYLFGLLYVLFAFVTYSFIAIKQRRSRQKISDTKQF